MERKSKKMSAAKQAAVHEEWLISKKRKEEEGRKIALTLPDRICDRLLCRRDQLREERRRDGAWNGTGRLCELSGEYLRALRDAGLISEEQREALLEYITA